MAASAYGRDYLAKKPEGQSLINLYCTTLSEAPTGPVWFMCCGHMYPLYIHTMTCKCIIRNYLSFAVPSSESKHLTSRTLYGLISIHDISFFLMTLYNIRYDEPLVNITITISTTP